MEKETVSPISAGIHVVLDIARIGLFPDRSLETIYLVLLEALSPTDGSGDRAGSGGTISHR